MFGILTSYFYGANTTAQQAFINKQHQLFAKPTASHYGLLLFAVVTIALCKVIPDWLFSALS